MSRANPCITSFVPLLSAAVVLLFIAIPAPPAQGEWLPDGTPVCTASGYQQDVHAAPDGLGGMVSVWFDLRDGTYQLFAQRLDAAGNVLWTYDGVDLDPIVSTQFLPDICGDGAGGAWIVWQKGFMNPIHVFLQHLDASGNPDWGPPGGMALGTGVTNHDHISPVCVSDGMGGVYAAWINRQNSDYVVRAQWVDSTGTIRWAPNGVQIGDDTASNADLDIVMDAGIGGVFVSWRSSGGGGIVQRVRADGTPRWGSNGWSLGSTTAGSTIRLADRERINGGVYILHRWHHSGAEPFDYDVLSVAAIDSAHYEFWRETIQQDDIDDNTPSDDFRILPDGMGGCVMTWDMQSPAGLPMGVFAQRLDRDGDKQWGSTRRRVSEIEDGNELPDLSMQYGMWNGLVTWVGMDGAQPRIKYRKLYRDTGVWLSDEVMVPGGYSAKRPVIVTEPDADTNPIIVWEDNRVVVTDVFATGLTTGGDPIAANLIVIEVTFAENPALIGQMTQASITAKNVGTQASGPFELAFYHHLSGPPYVGELPNGPIFSHPGLAVDEEVTWVSDILSYTVTTFSTYAFVDFRDAVEEFGDEDDNILGPVDLVWLDEPNLEVTNVTFSDTSPRVGDPVTATITVTNTGSAAAAHFDIDFYQNRGAAPGVGISGDQGRSVSNLAAGNSTVWTTDPFTSTEVATWRAWVQADTQGEVDEWKEDDNVDGPHILQWYYPVEEGWPVAVVGQLTSPALGALRPDLPGGRDIVVASETGTIYAWDADGDALPGWPHFPVTSTSIRSSVALGDVTGDGHLEVVVGTDEGDVACLANDGSSLWHFAAGGPVSATPVLADVVHAGGLEVVVATESGSIFVLDHTGTPLAGWPVVMPAGLGFYASPAVGQMDGAGGLEIVAIASSVLAKGPLAKAPQSQIHVLTTTGASYGAPWPITLGAPVVGSPALGDIVGDTDLEIAFGDLSGDLYVYTLGGNSGPFPVSLPGIIPTSPALWDADGDGDLDIAVTSEEYVSGMPSHYLMHQYVIDNAGSNLEGWPTTFGSPFLGVQTAQGPIAWGQDREGYLAVGSARGNCYVLHSTGAHPAGYAMSVNAPITGKAAVGDIDFDLQMEVVVCGDGEVCVYDLLEGSYAAHLLEWPMFRHDMYRTGVYGFESVTGVGPEPVVPSVARTMLHPPYPNPFNPSVTVPYTLKEAAEVRIAIFDLAGREVRELLREHRDEGSDAVVWNGRDAAGRRVGSGVYVVQLKVGSVTDASRVVLLQ